MATSREPELVMCTRIRCFRSSRWTSGSSKKSRLEAILPFSVTIRSNGSRIFPPAASRVTPVSTAASRARNTTRKPRRIHQDDDGRRLSSHGSPTTDLSPMTTDALR
ncbi:MULTISPECIES: hypothetical protein [unclassified Streptomyces]|uniref:hypothetical protein n=1 Tax=unclassified Streptomyces TaxID=2593676 RepID=UPI00081E9E67|nr:MULTISPECIES: hypothetical protein [unclassified Streptomyces]SCF60755.1 hypothetical protein GA0115259_1001011 [Streptomyces sp. MnatMP-M17]